jgi:hypothetical protein
MVTMNGSVSASAISVRSLINTHKLPKAVRAILGAEILAGERDLHPTVKLVAEAVGCSVAYVQAAQKLTPAQRQAVRRRERPLILPHTPAVSPKSPVPAMPPAPATSPVLPVMANAQHRLAQLVAEVGGVDAAIEMLIGLERAAAA